MTKRFKVEGKLEAGGQLQDDSSAVVRKVLLMVDQGGRGEEELDGGAIREAAVTG